MKHPKIYKNPRDSITVSSFEGGLNLNERPDMINDNQLTECVNLWYQDGMLQTRPAFCSKGNVFSTDGLGEVSFRNTGITISVEGRETPVRAAFIKEEGYTDIYLVYSDGYGDWREAASNGQLRLTSPHIRVEGATKGFIPIRYNGEFYVFTSAGIYTYSKESDSYTAVSDEMLYIPTVLSSATACDTYYSVCEGNIIEGYNALTKYYRAIYSTYDLNNPYDTVDSGGFKFHHMIYALPIKSVVGTTVRAVHKLSNGKTATHSVTITGETDSVENSKNEVDGLTMHIINDHICFYDGSTLKIINSNEYLKDNLEVIATWDNTKQKQKILDCNLYQYFGGSSGGIFSGTRLFLSGNDSEKSEIYYSGLNNPLYFSDSFKIAVGESSEAVTAFGRQNNMLVVFKNREIYSLTYMMDNNISADDLISGRVNDLSASLVYFPITQINASIGCDCPDSVVLCRNKLVWATSDGHIYTLSSADEYSVCNVYELSKMIEKKLKLCSGVQLQKSVAVQYLGNYILVVSDRAFVLDFGAYAFTHVYSYSSESKAQKNLSWYYWEMPYPIFALDSTGNLLSCVATNNGDSVFLEAKSSSDADSLFGDSMTNEKIEVTFTTKSFNFNKPNSKKSIGRVWLSAFSLSEKRIFITPLTDDKKSETRTLSLEAEGQRYVCINNPLPHTVHVGVMVKASGFVQFGNLCINYKLLRSVR